MTHAVTITANDETFLTLVELMAKPFVSPGDYQRIGRLAKIVARREGVSRETVFAMAAAEFVA